MPVAVSEWGSEGSSWPDKQPRKSSAIAGREVAIELNVSTATPLLVNGAYIG
jgi:hypothetical protein